VREQAWRRCGASGSHLGALTLTAQLLETRVDRRKIIGSSGTSWLATQFLDASADHRKIVSGTGPGHISRRFDNVGLSSPSG